MALLARDIMVKDVVCARDDMELDKLMQLFKEYPVRGFPVLNGEGELVGVVSTSDIVFRSAAFGETPNLETDYHHQLHDEGGAGDLLEQLEVDGIAYLKVRDIMSTAVISTVAEATVAEVAELMRTHRIHRVLVLGEGRLSGIVGTMDILKAVADERLS
ncbi:MAG: DHA2 family multidrug resistance protein-like MFS transporter [Candidatus Latescibacterota bacterium]|jgi:DHA2 family multidrug resistance protein-like MFS transporter